MPRWLATARQSASSLPSSWPNAAGVSCTGSAPSLTRRPFTGSAAAASLMARWSASTMAAGVFAGASTPHHVLTSKLALRAGHRQHRELAVAHGRQDGRHGGEEQTDPSRQQLDSARAAALEWNMRHLQARFLAQHLTGQM